MVPLADPSQSQQRPGADSNGKNETAVSYIPETVQRGKGSQEILKNVNLEGRAQVVLINWCGTTTHPRERKTKKQTDDGSPYPVKTNAWNQQTMAKPYECAESTDLLNLP